jgi:hypothetical protein
VLPNVSLGAITRESFLECILAMLNIVVINSACPASGFGKKKNLSYTQYIYIYL